MRRFFGNVDTVVDRCDHPGYETCGIVKVDLLRKYLPDAVAIAKFDVEGNECLALRGGLELLSGDRRPLLIQTEVWSRMTGCSQDEYLRMFSDAGYRYYLYPTEDQRIENVIFFEPTLY